MKDGMNEQEAWDACMLDRREVIKQREIENEVAKSQAMELFGLPESDWAKRINEEKDPEKEWKEAKLLEREWRKKRCFFFCLNSEEFNIFVRALSVKLLSDSCQLLSLNILCVLLLNCYLIVVSC